MMFVQSYSSILSGSHGGVTVELSKKKKSLQYIRHLSLVSVFDFHILFLEVPMES